mgnify:FL=1
MSVTETSRTTTRRRTRQERSTSSTSSSSSSTSRRTRGGSSTRERSTSTSRTEGSESRSETTTRSRRRPTRATEEEAQVDLSPEASRISSADAAERAVRSGDENREPRPVSSEPTEAERRAQEERDHISNLDRNFEIFDNPGGGDTDGTVSRGDIERVAEGDYDLERAEERLREAGVPDDEIDDHLAGIEETAEYLLDNDSVRDRLDVANDNDGEGDTDGKIARGDLDRVMVEVEAENREARVREMERAAQEPPSESHVREAQEAIDRWSEPGQLQRELEERPLNELSPAELDALAAVESEDPEISRQVEQAILRSVEEAESLEDLPRGDAFSYLLDRHVTGREITGNEAQQSTDPTAIAQRQLDGLVREEIEASLDSRLDDRRGDDELDLALERVSGDLEDLAISNPALAGSIQRQAEATFNDYADEFTEVARRDDNFFQQANHAITGAVRDGVGFLADGFRFAVDVSARVSSAPARLAGRVTNFALDAAGTVAGAGLDAVGAEGLADDVRSVSDRAGDLVQDGADFVADQSENFNRGLGESVAGGVEGIAYAVTDPRGTVEGIAQVVQDPSLLIDSYRQTAEEHGVAGAAGQLTGDVLLSVFTGGSGAAARGASVAGRVASIGGRGGRVASFAARGATRAQSFLDDVARAGGTARYASRYVRGLDDIPLNRTVRSIDSPDIVPSRSGADVLLEGQDVPGRVSGAIDRARRGAGDAFRRSDAESAVRRFDELAASNPQLISDIDVVRRQLEGVSGDPAALRRILGDADSPNQLDELAARLDEVSGGPTPGGVGDIVLEGRGNILNYLRDNFDNLNPRTAHNIVRGLFADSDPAAPAFLSRLREGDRVYRAFGGDTRASGGYYGRRADRGLGSDQQISNNALPSNNPADRGVEFAVQEDSVTLVTRVGDQRSNLELGPDGTPRFGDNTPGGGWQLQFLNDADIRSALKAITGDDSVLPPNITRFNPGEYVTPLLPLNLGPAAAFADIVEWVQGEENW